MPQVAVAKILDNGWTKVIRNASRKRTGVVDTGFVQTETVPWICKASPRMSMVKVVNGIRAHSMNLRERYYLTLSPDIRAVTKSYRVEWCPNPGGSSISVSPDHSIRDRRTLLTTLPISVDMDLRRNECVVRQGNIEFTLACKRLNIEFTNGYITISAAFFK